MNILLDTNILIYLARDSKRRLITEFINPNRKELYISVVSIAEVRSVALRQHWGSKKLLLIDDIITSASIIEVSQLLINTYVEIDTYSQRQNPNFTEYAFETLRNMGKNDLWIAATAGLLGLELITTDADFAHLHNVFLDIRQINPDEFRPFFN